MPVRELKAAYEKFREFASVVHGNEYANSLKLARVTEAVSTFRALVENNSQEDINEFLQQNPRALRTFAFKPEANLALINKASPIAINRAIEFFNREMMEGGEYHYYSALLTVLSDEHSSEEVLAALLGKVNLELLMEQYRKIPYSNFLLNSDSFYNEEHELILNQLIRIVESPNFSRDIQKHALYCIGSISLSLSLHYPEKPYLFRLAYVYLDHPEALIPLFNAYKTEKIISAQFFLKNKKDDRDGAAFLIQSAFYLSQFGKAEDKKALISTLEKLNKYSIPFKNFDTFGLDFHLRMAQVFGNKTNLALFNEKKRSAMLKKALSHAEIVRDKAQNVLHAHGNGGEGFDAARFTRLRDNAEQIIIALREGNQGQFSAEEENTHQKIAELENKIKNTNWIVKKLGAKYPAHVNLMLKEIEAYKQKIKSGPATWRAIEEIARKAAAEKKFLRDDETDKFYQAMSTSHSRNAYLSVGVTTYRDLFFNQRRDNPVVVAVEEEQPGYVAVPGPAAA